MQRGSAYSPPAGAVQCHAGMAETLCRVCGRQASCDIHPSNLVYNGCHNYGVADITYKCEQEDQVRQCINRCKLESFTNIVLCNPGSTIHVLGAVYGEELGNPLDGECNCCARLGDCLAAVSGWHNTKISQYCQGKRACDGLIAEVPTQAAPCTEQLSEIDYLTIYYKCVSVPTPTPEHTTSRTTTPTTPPSTTIVITTPSEPEASPSATTTAATFTTIISDDLTTMPSSVPMDISGVPVGVVSGLSVGLLVVFLIVVVAIVIYRRQRNKSLSHSVPELNLAPDSSHNAQSAVVSDDIESSYINTTTGLHTYANTAPQGIAPVDSEREPDNKHPYEATAPRNADESRHDTLTTYLTLYPEPVVTPESNEPCRIREQTTVSGGIEEVYEDIS